MAKYDITYTCGHKGTVELFGRSKDRERKFTWLKNSCKCPECEQKEREERINARKATFEDATGRKPAELKGTEKQIRWAEDIRSSVIKNLIGWDLDVMIEQKKTRLRKILAKENAPNRDIAAKNLREEIEKLPMVKAFLEHLIETMADASWWIDSDQFGSPSIVSISGENGHFSWLIDGMDAKRCRDEGVAAREPALYKEFTSFCDGTLKSAEEIVAEREMALMTPENAKSTTEVTVTVDGSQIKLRSDKDYDLIAKVKDMGFSWDGSRWVKSIPTAVADMQDAAAEIANALLNAGFPVLCKDAEVREKALTGSYTPVPTRYITSADDGLHICWTGRNDEVYEAARSIKGAKWDSGHMLVSPKHYDGIEGLEDMYGFVLSDGAREALDKAKATALISTVKVAPHKSEKAAGADLEAILERPAEVMSKHVIAD